MSLVSIQKNIALCATSGLAMFNLYLLVMLIWSAHVAAAQQQQQQQQQHVVGSSSSTRSNEVTGSAVIVDETRMRNVNGVTSNMNRAAGGGIVTRKAPSSRPAASPDNVNGGDGTSGSGLDILVSNDNGEGYWREVKAIIGGVLGFWGGVGGLGTMFLVVVLSQRYCCKPNDDKDDGD